RDLGIDFDPSSWDELMRSGNVLAVDVGLVNERTFLNNVAVGLYPRMLRQRARLEGEKLLGSKRLASWWATLQVMRQRVHTFTVHWEIDHKTGEFRTKALLVASNAYTGRPFAPLSREALNRRELVLFAPRSLRVRDIARMASYALAGNILDCPGLDTVSARDIRLRLKAHHVTAAVDGELVRLRSPISIRHHEQPFQAVVPEQAT
ncbi:MAG: diacylglycerol/lipid kinase family protein, partial [Pseudomonadales bacterium]